MAAREIDGCFVEIVLEHEVVRWQEAVKGRCRFRGGPKTTHFKQVEARLRLPSIEGQTAALHMLPAVWFGLEVAAGTVVEKAFEFAVPRAAGLGEGAGVLAFYWRQNKWIPVSQFVPMFLAPSRSYTDVLELIARLTGLRPGTWYPGALGDGVRIRLEPDPGTPKRVDALELELYRANGYLYGSLNIDPVNTGIAGALKDLASADLIRLKIRFPEGDLDEAARVITPLLRPYIDERGRLPIPADLAPETGVLPIPASALRPDTDTLPRPARSKDEEG